MCVHACVRTLTSYRCTTVRCLIGIQAGINTSFFRCSTNIFKPVKCFYTNRRETVYSSISSTILYRTIQLWDSTVQTFRLPFFCFSVFTVNALYGTVRTVLLQYCRVFHYCRRFTYHLHLDRLLSDVKVLPQQTEIK